jgi:hypothetical protein
MSNLSDNSPLALRIATIAWAAITLIHFTIWAMVCIIGGHLDSPWWLWIGLPPGVVIGALWWLATRHPSADA